MPHLTVMGFMIAALLSRYIRYWYTYLTAVMYFLYTQQLTCDAGVKGCVANISVHPEDRFVASYDPGRPRNDVVIVGIDNESLQTLGHYPISRDLYAQALQVLQKDGAAAVG